MAVGTLSARADQVGPRTGCALTGSSCTYDSGLKTVSNNCQARVFCTWWRTDNEMDVSVEVKNANAFVGGRAYGTPYLQTTSGKDDTGSKSSGYSCGTWDPTCGADQARTYVVPNAVPSADVATIDQMWGC